MSVDGGWDTKSIFYLQNSSLDNIRMTCPKYFTIKCRNRSAQGNNQVVKDQADVETIQRVKSQGDIEYICWGTRLTRAPTNIVDSARR